MPETPDLMQALMDSFGVAPPGALWHAVYCADSGRGTDFIVMEGDPIRGSFVACCDTMEQAHHIADLHNERDEHRQLLRDLVDRIEGEGYTGWAAELRTEHGL